MAVVSAGHRDKSGVGAAFPSAPALEPVVSWYPGTSCSRLTLFPVPFPGTWPVRTPLVTLVSLADVWWPSWLSLCLWLPWPVQ